MAKVKCQHIAKQFSAYVDGQLDAGDRRALALHIERCPQCSSEVDRYVAIRRSLRSLPRAVAPADLGTRLRIIASRERSRVASRGTFTGLLADWWTGANVWLDNLMYPMALPFAGGLASAVMLFAVLVSGVVVPPGLGRSDDVPTVFYTEASVRSTGPLSYTDDVEVDLIIDEQGRVLDYTLPPSVMGNPELRRTVETNLIVTRFNPATTFGYPTLGRVKLSFKKSHIDVKG